MTIVDSSYATQNGLGLDDTVSIAGRVFTIVGQTANANVYLSLADARAMASVAPNVLSVRDMGPDDANLLFLEAEQTQAEEVVDAAEVILGEQALVSSVESFGEHLGSLFEVIDRFGVIVGLVAFLFAVAILVRTVAAGVWERRREIAMMRAMGWRRSDITRQLMSETLVVTFLGGLIGLALAWLMTAAMRSADVTVPVPWELGPQPISCPAAQPT